MINQQYMSVLRIDNLSKSYGNIKAVQNLNLNIGAGEIYGILGPNGSGKTTTLGMITGVLKSDSGSFTWFDGKYKNPNLRLGTILETPNFFPYLNASENLEIVRHIKKSDETDFTKILELVNLAHRSKSKFSGYSLGMKQRLAIAATMIGNPDVVIFDEPTNGLDPQGIADVRTTLKNIAATGKTVILASHILDEVEKICSHVAIIKNGVLLNHGRVGSILSSDINVQLAATDMEKLNRWIISNPNISSHFLKDNFYDCMVEEDYPIELLSKDMIEVGLYPTHLLMRNQSLEEEFLKITGNA